MIIWKDIKGYEGIYQISSTGQVRNRKGLMKLKTNKQRGDYKIIGLTKDKNNKKFYVHRLVGLEFIDNPFNKPEINHIDGNKSNNNVSNLEWVTKKENMSHAVKTGLHGGKPITSIQKFNQDTIEDIKKLIEDKVKYRIISEKYNISTGMITLIKQNKRRSYGKELSQL